MVVKWAWSSPGALGVASLLGAVLIASAAWAGALEGPTRTGWTFVSGAATFEVVYEGGSRAAAYVEASCKDGSSAPATSCCAKSLTRGGATTKLYVDAGACSCNDFDKAVSDACSAVVRPIVLTCSAALAENEIEPLASSDGSSACSLDWKQPKTDKVKILVLGTTGPGGGGSVKARLRTN